MFSTEIVTLDQRAAFMDLLAASSAGTSLDLGEIAPASRGCAGQIVRVRANRVIRRRSAAPAARVAEHAGSDLGALSAAFVERLRDAGVAVTADGAERCSGALQAGSPPSRRSLYYLTRETLVTDAMQLATFNEVFADVFGAPAGADRYREQRALALAAAI
jgi:uncharacterized protein with von Willebrand factor type A (vWA) domain